MRHHVQRNGYYRPRFRISIHWTWRGKTHYVDIGSDKNRPAFPGRR